VEKSLLFCNSDTSEGKEDGGEGMLREESVTAALTEGEKQDFAITLCHRGVSATRGQQSTVAATLIKAGYNVTEVREGPLNLAADGVAWILGNANWFPLAWRQLQAAPRSKRPFMVIWHYEPLPPPRAAKLPWPRPHLREVVKILLRRSSATDVYSNYLRLRSLARHGLPDLLVVSTLSRREFLAECGITAHWAPMGYHPSLGRDLGLPRDIDVLFLGDVKIPRRKPLLAQLQQHRVNLMAVGDWSDPAYWGENRTRLLNRTKIFLNVQRYTGELSGQRLLIGMANKALVISEPMYNPAPYVSGKHYLTATIEEMPEVIRYYLTHEDERRAMVEDAYRLVTQEVTLEHSLSRILALIKTQREQVPRENMPTLGEAT
jgi:hypothetical protein